MKLQKKITITSPCLTHENKGKYAARSVLPNYIGDVQYSPSGGLMFVKKHLYVDRKTKKIVASNDIGDNELQILVDLGKNTWVTWGMPKQTTNNGLTRFDRIGQFKDYWQDQIAKLLPDLASYTKYREHIEANFAPASTPKTEEMTPQ